MDPLEVFKIVAAMVLLFLAVRGFLRFGRKQYWEDVRAGRFPTNDLGRAARMREDAARMRE